MEKGENAEWLVGLFLQIERLKEGSQTKSDTGAGS